MMQKAYVWSGDYVSSLRSDLNGELSEGWMVELKSIKLLPKTENQHSIIFFCTLIKPEPTPPQPVDAIASIKL